MIGLYHNEGNGLYVDEAPASTVGRASMLTLAFGIFFFDYDLDGRLDIFAGNGHVADDIAAVQPSVTHAQLPHVFRNMGDRRFEPVASKLGPALQRPIVARGAAYGDIDNDGDLDVVVSTNDGPAVVFRNDGGNRNRFLRVKTIGTKSNRDGIGAKVTVTLADRSRQWRLVRTGSSYCSQSDTAVTFGLGANQRVESIEVAWPSGQVDRTGPVVANQVAFVEEGRGLVSAKPLPAKGSRPRALSPGRGPDVHVQVFAAKAGLSGRAGPLGDRRAPGRPVLDRTSRPGRAPRRRRAGPGQRPVRRRLDQPGRRGRRGGRRRRPADLRLVPRDLVRRPGDPAGARARRAAVRRGATPATRRPGCVASSASARQARANSARCRLSFGPVRPRLGVLDGGHEHRRIGVRSRRTRR